MQKNHSLFLNNTNIMDDDSIDECFLSETVSPKNWWEARRLSYNKVCLVVGIIILIISSILLITSQENDFFSRGDIQIIWLMGLIYFIFGNVAYTLTWMVESIFKINFSESIRQNFFVIFIILTLLIPAALFIMLLILIN